MAERDASLEQCLEDVDFFIARFEETRKNDQTGRFDGPLLRLKDLRVRLEALPVGEVSPEDRAARFQRVAIEELHTLRAEVAGIKKATGGLKPTIKTLEGLQKQVISLAGSAVEAAARLKKSGASAPSAADEGGDEVDERALGAVATVVNRIDRKLNKLKKTVASIAKSAGGAEGEGGGSLDLGPVQEAIAALGESLTARLDTEGESGGLAELSEQVGRVSTRLGMVEANFGIVKTRSDEIQGALRGLPERLAANTQALELLPERLEGIEGRLDRLREAQRAAAKASEGLLRASQLDEKLLDLAEVLGEKAPGGEGAAPGGGAPSPEVARSLGKIEDRLGSIDTLSTILMPLTQSLQSVTEARARDEAVSARVDWLADCMTAIAEKLEVRLPPEPGAAEDAGKVADDEDDADSAGDSGSDDDQDGGADGGADGDSDSDSDSSDKD